MPGKSRTLNFQIRSLILYPIELQALPGEKGFEPLTYGFGDHCSTIGTILLLFETRPFRLTVRTSLFHGENTGSIPVRDTKKINMYGGIPPHKSS